MKKLIIKTELEIDPDIDEQDVLDQVARITEAYFYYDPCVIICEIQIEEGEQYDTV